MLICAVKSERTAEFGIAFYPMENEPICARSVHAPVELRMLSGVGSHIYGEEFQTDLFGNPGATLTLTAAMNATIEVLAKWRGVGGVDPKGLVDARLQLHHAAQIIVSAAISHLAPRADDSHTNLEWIPSVEALGTNWLTSKERVRYALRPDTFSLLALNDNNSVTSELALEGRTNDDAVRWLRDSLDAAGYSRENLSTKKHYEIPAHAVAAGAPYRFAAQEHAELGRYYANAHELTSHVAGKRAGASEPRCWPHHFDLATLITLPQIAGRGTRTVGVGLSPGDDSYAEPYFYVGPYPHPSRDRLTSLGALGIWHTKGWVAAVLRASESAALGDAKRQADGVASFAEAAIGASIAALA
jgi:hypothetical protein